MSVSAQVSATYSPDPVLAVATTATEEADSVATVALGPTKEVARSAEQRVADDRQRHHVEAVLDRHTGDPGVGHRLRHHQRPDRQPGRRVGGQSSAVVATKPR